MVREVIGRKLATYYSQPSSTVVGSTLEATNFRSLWGEWHWKRVYASQYRQQSGQWLTPVELFKPFYSKIVASFIQSSVNARESIEIVELGGGTGTNCCEILDHFQATDPALYHHIHYNIFDCSESLLELQSETVRQRGHSDVVAMHHVDLMDIANGKQSLFSTSTSSSTVAIALELFDNLPHDKIRVRGSTIEQVEIDHNREALRDLADPLLKRVLRNIPQHMYAFAHNKCHWIPTVACGLIERIAMERPGATMLISDFDWLPPADKFGKSQERSSYAASGEPLITSMDDQDHECYLNAPAHVDILFPTNFNLIREFAENIWNVRKGDTPKTISVHKQNDFLRVTNPALVEGTKSWLTGYSPLVHDFSNCSVLTVANKRDP